MSSHCHPRDHCHLQDHCHPRDHCQLRDHCHIRDLCHLQNLRQIQKQMRMLDLRLQLLRDRLCAARLHRLALPCCCSHHHIFRCPGRKALIARAKRLGMLLSSSCCHNPLVDTKCFDPRDVSVTVKDGRVTVSAEHKDECNTGLSKSSSYRKYMKEFSLPPGEEEVTYSVESNSLTKIEPPKCCSHFCDF